MRMKINTQKISMLAMAVLLIVGQSACGGQKKKAEEKKPPEGETLIKQYCAGPDYYTDNKTFRANNLGESLDQATAKKKAMANARADLASSIQTTMQGVIDNYVNSREFNNQEEVEERFEGLTREVLDQSLTGVKVICEEVVKTAEGKFKYYIALELSGADLVADYNSAISNDERLRIDYDYEKFKETFEAEMDKLKGN